MLVLMWVFYPLSLIWLVKLNTFHEIEFSVKGEIKVVKMQHLFCRFELTFLHMTFSIIQVGPWKGSLL